ncbi:cysteine-rich secretory protein LCCL domain-containing 2-like, partial [Symsagittifera roscoffensis]|uniref:cysteine-rich secretory protein LCCL domain-containing 2-like n=1 Tax=Symsagittifera roscoffensis TaxID=84072 RepID=UPI00307C939E
VNIYTSLDEMSTTRADIIRVGCQWWYDEISDYEYPGPNNSFLYCSKTDLEDVRHFTQMMWNETERIGCAVHRCKNEEQEKSREEASLGICVYEPAGNQKDQPLFTQENYEGLCAAEPDRFKTCVP